MIISLAEGVNLADAETSYVMIFPGQLSEKSGMAAQMRFHPVFRRLAPGFDQLTGGRFDRWVTEAPQEEIAERFTAPAIMVLYDILCAEIALYEWGPPVAVAGYSLGFYAAAVLTKCVPVAAVLTWLEKVNAHNARAFPPGEFALAAATGVTAAELKEAFAAEKLRGLKIANVNNPRQVVFAGPASQVSAALDTLKGRVLDARLLPLDVPLHTSYLESACHEVETWWSAVAAGAPVFPLLSPVDGRVIGSGAAFKSEMLRSLHSATRWDLVAEAIAKLKPERVLDLSPGGDLGRMARWTARELNVVPVSALWSSPAE